LAARREGDPQKLMMAARPRREMNMILSVKSEDPWKDPWTLRVTARKGGG
jgi:hypothetical protein